MLKLVVIQIVVTTLTDSFFFFLQFIVMCWFNQVSLSQPQRSALKPFRIARLHWMRWVPVGDKKEASLGHNFTPLQTYKHEAPSPLGLYQTNPQPNLTSDHYYLCRLSLLLSSLWLLAARCPSVAGESWIKVIKNCLTFLPLAGLTGL